uniref:DUF834 domain-containing protein n=1 Tax=Oryza punctata TaxID=4537 RepID=A0A0E0KVB1_ORYPU
MSVHAELVHDPLGLGAPGGSPLVEHQRLPHPDHRAAAGGFAGGGGAAAAAAGDDGAVLARGLPVAGAGGAVGALPRGVLAVVQAEEVPLRGAHPRGVCSGRRRRRGARGKKMVRSCTSEIDDLIRIPGSSHGSHLLRSTSTMATPP